MKTLKMFLVCFMILGLVSMLSTARADILMVPDPYTTIQEAVNAANPDGGDVIMVGPGTYYGAEINKPVEIIGCGQAIINDGPLTPFGPIYLDTGFYLPPGHNEDGTKISNFTITDRGYPIVARGADDITISHLTITDFHLGIFIAGGANWEITHNKIYNVSTELHPLVNKLGIVIRGTSAYEVNPEPEKVSENNLIAFNDIDIDMTNAEYHPPCGGVLFMLFQLEQNQPTDAFDQFPGPIQNNKVVHNKIKVNGGIVDPVHFSASFGDADLPFALPAPYGDGERRIEDNCIAFNDFRGSQLDLGFFPPSIQEKEIISKNHSD